MSGTAALPQNPPWDLGAVIRVGVRQKTRGAFVLNEKGGPRIVGHFWFVLGPLVRHRGSVLEHWPGREEIRPFVRQR